MCMCFVQKKKKQKKASREFEASTAASQSQKMATEGVLSSQTLWLLKHPAVPCDRDPPTSLFLAVPCS